VNQIKRGKITNFLAVDVKDFQTGCGDLPPLSRNKMNYFLTLPCMELWELSNQTIGQSDIRGRMQDNGFHSATLLFFD